METLAPIPRGDAGGESWVGSLTANATWQELHTVCQLSLGTLGSKNLITQITGCAKATVSEKLIKQSLVLFQGIGPLAALV